VYRVGATDKRWSRHSSEKYYYDSLRYWLSLVPEVLFNLPQRARRPHVYSLWKPKTEPYYMGFVSCSPALPIIDGKTQSFFISIMFILAMRTAKRAWLNGFCWSGSVTRWCSIICFNANELEPRLMMESTPSFSYSQSHYDYHNRLIGLMKYVSLHSPGLPRKTWEYKTRLDASCARASGGDDQSLRHQRPAEGNEQKKHSLVSFLSRALLNYIIYS